MTDEISELVASDHAWLAERLGSGDGERKTLLTRQITFEPLPASVLFALVIVVVVAHGRLRGRVRVASARAVLASSTSWSGV